jgi:DNA-binding MarR family transcriptional regulator
VTGSGDESTVDMTELDPVIHAQARLRVVVALSTVREGDRMTFPWLRKLLQVTAGNLSVHLRKLEDAGYVTITKTHRGRTPTTYVELNRRGRLAFEEYTDQIRRLLESTTPPEETPAPRRSRKAATVPADVHARNHRTQGD